MKIDGHTIKFTDKNPQAEGKYLWHSGHTNALAVITVHHYPANWKHGIHFDAYYGVLEYRGRNVLNLIGKFCEIELDKTTLTGEYA